MTLVRMFKRIVHAFLALQILFQGLKSPFLSTHPCPFIFIPLTVETMVLNASALNRIRLALHLLLSCIFIGIQPFFVYSAPAPAPAPSPGSTKLIHDICKNTTNYNFCEKSFLSNPSTNPLPTDPLAQQKAAAKVAFGLACGYASYVNDYIDHLLKNATNLEQQLQECAVYYGVAIEELIDSLDDINDDNMTALGGPAATASLASSGCDAASKGGHNSPLAAMNRRMRLLSEICLVVSKLFAKQFACTISSMPKNKKSV